jgi:hypothetical protein
VSWLRPSRTVVDPHGTQWEIYVTRARIGSWNALDTGLDPPLTASKADDVWFVLVPLLMLLELVVGILKLIALVPFGLFSAATHRSLRVEAIVEYPARQTYGWDVARPVLERVLDEIVEGLEHGTIAHPADARFLGVID